MLLVSKNLLSLRYYLISGKFISFCSQLNMIWSNLTKYSISGTRWGVQSIHECINKNLKCLKTEGSQRTFKVLLNLREFFFWGCKPSSPHAPRVFFLNTSVTPDGFAWNFVPVNKISLGTFWHKKNLVTKPFAHV